MNTRSKLKSVLEDILLKIEDDNAPSVGGDDTVIDLETDANLIILAVTQLHNKYGARRAHRDNLDYDGVIITKEQVQDQNRGGYSVSDWNRIFKTLTGEKYVETSYDSGDIGGKDKE